MSTTRIAIIRFLLSIFSSVFLYLYAFCIKRNKLFHSIYLLRLMFSSSSFLNSIFHWIGSIKNIEWDIRPIFKWFIYLSFLFLTLRIVLKCRNSSFRYYRFFLGFYIFVFAKFILSFSKKWILERLVDDSEGNLTIKLRSEMIICSTRSEIEKRGILMIRLHNDLHEVSTYILPVWSRI